MTEVRNRVSGLASPGDSAADKQRRLGDLLDRQGRAQSHLTHLEGVRDRLKEKCTASEEAVVEQEALLVDLADQVREAKLATKTPPESDDGSAESAVDSDLKSRADDDMADEAEEPLLPTDYGAVHTQGNMRRMVAKAKSAPFIANNMDQTREFWDNLTPESHELLTQCMKAEQAARPQDTPVGNDPAPRDAEGWVLVSGKKESRLAQLGSSHKSTKDKVISFDKCCARSLVSGKGQSSPKLSFSGSRPCVSAQSAPGPFVEVAGSPLPELVKEAFSDPDFQRQVRGLEAMLRVRERSCRIPSCGSRTPTVTVTLQMVLKAFALRLESVVSTPEVWRLSRRE